MCQALGEPLDRIKIESHPNRYAAPSSRRLIHLWSSASGAASARFSVSSTRAEVQGSDHGTTSEEFRQLCDCQLRFLSEILSPRGELVASVYIRVPSSLHSGDLELERIAWTPDPARGLEHGQAQASILIGGAGSKLTEERVISQPTMSLPRRGHVVLPLSSNGFLVRSHCTTDPCARLSPLRHTAGTERTTLCIVRGCGGVQLLQVGLLVLEGFFSPNSLMATDWAEQARARQPFGKSSQHAQPTASPVAVRGGSVRTSGFNRDPGFVRFPCPPISTQHDSACHKALAAILRGMRATGPALSAGRVSTPEESVSRQHEAHQAGCAPPLTTVRCYRSQQRTC